MTYHQVKSRRTSKIALLSASVLTSAAMLGMTGVAARAQDAAPAAAPAAADDTVIVTGYRGSLQSSAAAKKRAVGFQDSVFSEDIGKFPDSNIAESINRIPGVTIAREINGDGVNIAIRGLGTSFTKVLLNGAPVSVASTGSTDSQNTNREVDLDLFPTELFTSLTVDKSPQAHMIEGGAAGVVNMRQARPFDHKGNQLVYSLEGTKNSNADDWGDKGSLLASGTWGNFGLIGGVAFSNEKVANSGFESIGWTNANLNAAQNPASTRNNTGGGNWTIPGTLPSNTGLKDGSGVLIPDGTTIDQAFLLQYNPGTTIDQIDNGLIPRLGRPMNEWGTRDRISGIVGAEWRPSEDFHAYIDMMYAHKKNAMQRTDMDWVGRNGSMIPLDLTFDRTDCANGCTVTGGTFANAQFFLEYRPYTETTDFQSFNPGFDWKISDKLDWDLSADYTRSTFHRESPTVLVITAPSSGVTATYKNDGDMPTVTSNVSINDPANFGWNGGRVNIQDEKRITETKGAHTDLKWGDSNFNIAVGAAYDDVSRRITAYDNSQAWQNATCGDNPSVVLPSPNFQPPCLGANTTTPPTSTVSPLPSGAYPAYAGYGTGYTAGQTGPVTWSGSLIPLSALASYLSPGPYGYVSLDWDKFAADSHYDAFHDAAPVAGSSNTSANTGFVDEKASAIYLEVNGDRDMMGHRLRYNFGARSISTDQTIGGLVSVPDPRNSATPAPVDGGKYPNTVSWVYTKSNYKNFLPSASIDYFITDNLIAKVSVSNTMTRPNPNVMLPGLNFSSPSADTGSVGNPALKPYISKNKDFGLEWYTGKEGFVALTVFNKRMNGFTTNGNTTVPLSALAAYGVTYDTLNPTQQQALKNRCGCTDLTVINAETVTLSEQVNIAGLETISGTEFTWVQPLGQWWTPLDGFGFSSNYTKIKERSGVGVPVATGIPDSTYNVTAYYENHGLSVHVSDNFTGKELVGTLGQNGIAAAGLYADQRSQVDLSASLDLGEAFHMPHNLQITLDATNLTNQPLKTYFQFENASYAYYKPGSTVMLGIRGKF